MLRVSKCILHLTYFNIQNMRQVSTKRHVSKASRIKKLMKEYKSVFGVLVETNAQKKKRIKLEKKGKIHEQKPNNTDTELQWVKENVGSNLKKIIVSAESPNQHKDTIQCTSESTLDSDRTNRTDASSLSDQSHTDDLTNPKSQTKRFSKKFHQVILRIKPADQNVENVESNRATQKMEVEITNPTCDLSTVRKDIGNNYDEVISATNSNFDQSIATENSNLRNNEPLIKSDKSDIEDMVAKYDFSSNFERLPNIIIKNLLSFPLVGGKQDSSAESTEVLSISSRDDPKTMRFPSVTRILTQTMPLESKLALEAWKERMIKKLGQEGFDMHQKALLEDGASLHSCIARSLLKKEYEIPPRIEPVFQSVQCVLGDVSHVKAIETHVAHTKLRYKGVIDCIASYRGENYVIDWKKSERKKLDLKETYDAPIQLAAYVGAINASNLYPFVIKRGLLVVAYTCGEPATVYEVRDDTLQQYWTAWLRRLQKYYVETANSDDNKNTQ